MLVYWRVWVDLNQDDDFNDVGEQFYQGMSGSQGFFSGQFFILGGLFLGSICMWIVVSIGGYSVFCVIGGICEVEDYQLIINNLDFLIIILGSFSILYIGGIVGFSIEFNINW